MTSGVFRELVAPNGLDRRVAELLVHDPVVPPRIESGDLVLAVGVRAESEDAVALVEAAGQRKAAAVVLKIHEDEPPTRLLQAARAVGIALFQVPVELEWGRLNNLLHVAITRPRPALDAHASSVPIGDLFALADALAASAGGPVAILDPQFRLLAYSSLDQPIDDTRLQSIISRRALESWVRRAQEDGTLRRLWQSQDVVRVDAYVGEGLLRRLAIAVRAGDETVGSIWVSEGSIPLGSKATKALREVAPLAALHIIRHRSAEDLGRHLRGELVQTALEGREPELVAKRLGFDPKSRLTVIAFENQSTDEVDLAQQQRGILDLVTVHCEAFQRSASVSIASTVYALVETPESVGGGMLLALAERIAQNARSGLGATLYVGIGSIVPLRETARSKEEADHVCRILAMDPEDRVVAHVDEVQAKIVLLDLIDWASANSLEFTKLKTLAEHDAQHGTPYLETLREYLDAFGHIPRAATKLRVHPNTLRYRLTRLADVSGLNLDDPEERLITDVSLRQLRRSSD